MGAGKMATAIMTGLLKKGVPASFVSAADVYAPALDVVGKEGVFTSTDNKEVAARGDIILIAVKPNDVPGVLSEIREIAAGKTLISIAAGVTIATLEASLDKSTRVIRVMPNICATVRESACALAAGSAATPEDMAVALDVFSSIGTALETKEYLLDAVTGLSGSGPAFVFPVIEAMADGGVRAGLDRRTAQILAAQTVLGAARMVLETGDHPGVLKDMVCSPAGTTIEGVKVLEEAGIRAAFMNAVIAAADKSADLGRKAATKN